eukprot:IDg7969t1
MTTANKIITRRKTAPNAHGAQRSFIFRNQSWALDRGAFSCTSSPFPERLLTPQGASFNIEHPATLLLLSDNCLGNWR